MPSRVKVSKKSQIAIPASVRRQLQISSGDHLLVEAQDGYVVLIPEPKDYSQRLRGLHREIWEGVDPQEYVRREREAWQHSQLPTAFLTNDRDLRRVTETQIILLEDFTEG